MSTPREAKKVKFIGSLFSSEQNLIEKAIKQMEGSFGPVDWVSERLAFDRTRYYVKEMGWPLWRRFISFANLIMPESLVDIKLVTNTIENGHHVDGKRKINIDPGYVSLERLILASGKNYTHRIYLSKGIYADLTLVFHAGTFKPLSWTYPDYTDEGIIGYFNVIRDGYLHCLRGDEREREEG